jgi:hypothetical protein
MCYPSATFIDFNRIMKNGDISYLQWAFLKCRIIYDLISMGFRGQQRPDSHSHPDILFGATAWEVGHESHSIAVSGIHLEVI